MQMSRYSVFVFVEGKIADPYFYGKISSSVCKQNGVSYCLCKADELSGIDGGKQVLLSFFKYLKNNSSLICDFKEKKTGVIFYLDKDVDDILRKKRKSPHLVYTTYYDVYNHIFNEGNIAEALSAAASLDPQFVQTRMGDCQILRCTLANLWKDWVKLCLFTAKKKARCRSNYRSISRINKSGCGSVDLAIHNNHIRELKSILGISDEKFQRSFNHLSKFVDGKYSDGRQDEIFKGKWYCFLFAEYVRALKIKADCNGLGNRLPYLVASSIDFDQHWSEHFKQPLVNIIRQL